MYIIYIYMYIIYIYMYIIYIYIYISYIYIYSRQEDQEPRLVVSYPRGVEGVLNP